MTKKAISYKAPAKINLFLEILKKRDDGYNEIQTIFSMIEVYDRLNFVLTKKDTIKILTDTDCLKEEDNLVYKIAVFIKKKYDVNSGVEIELEKNIPIAAGLGGGSSDAAAAIIALNTLWELSLSKSELHDIARVWGSDINFFLETATALGEGRGDNISSIPVISYENLLLVNPRFGISSSEAYNLVETGYQIKDYKDYLADPTAKKCFNRLQKGICRQYPAIEKMINYLIANGAEQAILSGSGPTVIGFCPNEKTAQKLSQYYTDKGYWNTITRTKGEPNEHYRCKGFYS